MTATVLCECNGRCMRSVNIPLDIAKEVVDLHGTLFVIVDGCPNGPDPSDVLVEKGEGYTLYRETNDALPDVR